MVSGTCANKANWSLAEPTTLVLLAEPKTLVLFVEASLNAPAINTNASRRRLPQPEQPICAGASAPPHRSPGAH